jgi:hypothetical protein
MQQHQKCVEKVLLWYICETPRMAIMRDDRKDVTGTETVKLINKIETVNIEQTLFHMHRLLSG